MSYFIYSQEGFPGTKESGRMHEYALAHGVQIIIKPKTWQKLQSRYSRVTPAQDITMQQVTRVFSAEEIAEELEHQFGFLGLVATQKENDVDRKQLEKKAEQANLKFRAKTLKDFESGRQKAIMSTKGRTEPSDYELECYAVLARPIPGEIEININKPASRTEAVAS